MKHEIGDGTRFVELAYVWDPNTIWTLLVRCTYPDYNAFISAIEIVNSAEVGVGLKIANFYCTCPFFLTSL